MHHQRWRRQSDRQLMPHGNTDSKKGASLQLQKVLPTQNPTASKILFKNKGEIKIISMRGNYESLSPKEWLEEVLETESKLQGGRIKPQEEWTQ